MSERKRIAIYAGSFPPKWGGIAAAHYNIFCHLSERHDVRAFIISDESEPDTTNVVRGRPLPGQRTAFRFALRRLLKQKPGSELPNIDSIADAAASVSWMNRSLAKFRPHLIICPDYDVPALLLKKPPGSKLAWAARHNYLRFTQQPLLPPENWTDLLLSHRLERRGLKKADLVISPSHYMLKVLDQTLGVDLPQYVAKNFVTTARIDRTVASNLRRDMHLHDDTTLIYIPDGGSPVKGARYTFEIIRRLSHTGKTAFYVPGNMGSCLKHELSTTYGLKVYAPGAVSYDTNLSNVAACDFGISPTLVENLSNALVESILLGIPIVTFDTGGNKEIIIDNETGFVVPYGDVESLISTAEQLVHLNSKRCLLRKNCAPHARRIIDADSVMNVYETVINKSLEK
jgi:glycosyltransferase involved in cell wall biosynthesis